MYIWIIYNTSANRKCWLLTNIICGEVVMGNYQHVHMRILSYIHGVYIHQASWHIFTYHTHTIIHILYIYIYIYVHIYSMYIYIGINGGKG